MSASVKYRYPYSYRKRHCKTKTEIGRKAVSLAPIDVCRRKGLIDNDEFFAANFFLSLYRLRYGSMLVRAHDFGIKGYEYKGIKSEEWYERRNELYTGLIRELTKAKLTNNFLKICVYEEYPNFLKKLGQTSVKISSEYQKLKEALAIIYDFLKKNYSLNYQL